MPDPVQVAASIRGIIATSWPHRFPPGELRDDVSLGEGGLGLDSIEIVELLLACEDHCGRPVTEELFAVLPLTIALAARYFADA